MSNIWFAAAEGDLARVQELVEHDALSPNTPDDHTYTPMHAAASYGQLHVLAYLVQQGGDVNITDEDGDTPLYAVEDIDTARWLLDHGALVDRRNAAGVSPVAHLDEDFPTIAAFLRGRSDPVRPRTLSAERRLSQHSQDAASVHDITQRAEAEGTDPDEEEPRAVVSQTVLAGDDLSTDAAPHDRPSKRPRMNGTE